MISKKEFAIFQIVNIHPILSLTTTRLFMLCFFFSPFSFFFLVTNCIVYLELRDVHPYLLVCKACGSLTSSQGAIETSWFPAHGWGSTHSNYKYKWKVTTYLRTLYRRRGSFTQHANQQPKHLLHSVVVFMHRLFFYDCEKRVSFPELDFQIYELW